MPTTTRTPDFCTQCRSRCGCVAVVEDGRLTGIEPLPGHPPPATSSVPRAAPQRSTPFPSPSSQRLVLLPKMLVLAFAAAS
jgi:hypothetical protein